MCENEKVVVVKGQGALAEGVLKGGDDIKRGGGGYNDFWGYVDSVDRTIRENGCRVCQVFSCKRRPWYRRDNSSCLRGANAPATYSITVEQFDEGSEETYERIFRACNACNRSCRKSFMGHRIKACVFDNSAREALTSRDKAQAVDVCPAHTSDSTSRIPEPTQAQPNSSRDKAAPPSPRTILTTDNTLATTPPYFMDPVLSSAAPYAPDSPLGVVGSLHDALYIVNARPPTPAAFVATVRVKHDAACSHPVASCSKCSLGLVCCDCNRLFAPAVARHLSCMNCKHIASTCCTSGFFFFFFFFIMKGVYSHIYKHTHVH